MTPPVPRTYSTARMLVFAALSLGLSYSWLAPCLVCMLDHALVSVWLFAAWSGLVAVGGLLVLLRIWEGGA